MKRTLALTLVAVMAALLAALAGVVAFRTALVEGGLEWWLNRQGFADADIEVRDVSLRRLDLGRSRLGGDGAPTAESVAIAFAPLELVRGRIHAVDVTGLRARARIAPDGIGLAGLPGGFTGAGGGDGGLIPGAVTLGDARIDLETPAGDAVARLDGTLAWQGAQTAADDLALVVESAHGRLAGRLAIGPAEDGIEVVYTVEDGVLRLPGVEEAALAGRASMRLRDGAVAGAALDLRVPETGVSGRRSGIAVALEGAYAPERARLAATFTEEDARGEARAVLHLAEPLGRRRLAAEAEGTVSAGSALWSLAGLPAPSAGRVRVAATARGDAGLDRMQGEARLEVEGLAHPSVGEGIAGEAHARFALAEGVLTATLTEPASLSGTLARSVAATAGAPAWLAEALRGALALRLEGTGDAPFRVTVAPADGGHRIEVAGGAAISLAAGESATARGTLAIVPKGLSAAADVEVALPRLAGPALVAEGVAMRVPLALAVDDAAATLRLTGPGRLAADRVALGDAASLAKPLAWTLVAGEAPLARLEGARLAYALFLRDGANELAIPASKSPGTGADAGTRLTLAAAALDVRGETEGGGSGAEATFRAVLGHAQRPAWFVPVRVAASLRLAGETLSFDATAEDDGGTTRGRAQGTFAGGRTLVSVRLGPFAFAPAGLQPAALFPALAALGNVSGAAAAELEYRQAAGRAREGGVLRLQDLSFEAGGVGVRDLDAEVRLDGIFPPSTPPGQTLSIARVDVVSTLEEVRASFQVEARPRPRLRLATARAGFAGGEMRIDDVVLAAGSPPPSLTVGIRGVKIEPLLEVIGLESVRATGELSGAIPIRFLDGEAVAIEDGRLAADGAGVLQVRSPEIAAALAAGGQSAELMGRVLEDFHYDAFSIDVAKSAEGEARVLLHLSGNNPAVLEGHPFVFNINVASNVDELVKALLRGYRLTADALRRAAERDGGER